MGFIKKTLAVVGGVAVISWMASDGDTVEQTQNGLNNGDKSNSRESDVVPPPLDPHQGPSGHQVPTRDPGAGATANSIGGDLRAKVENFAQYTMVPASRNTIPGAGDYKATIGVGPDGKGGVVARFYGFGPGRPSATMKFTITVNGVTRQSSASMWTQNYTSKDGQQGVLFAAQSNQSEQLKDGDRISVEVSLQTGPSQTAPFSSQAYAVKQNELNSVTSQSPVLFAQGLSPTL